MSESYPFSIRIFVVSGDPDGLRIVERSNWPGRALVFPRSLLPEIKAREEFQQTGVYLLIGPREDGEGDMLYIGEGDPVLPRLESHYAKKDFWNRAAFFSTTTGALNKAHVQYIESRLISQANQAKRAWLDNVNQPKPASLNEADQADMEVFIGHMLQILPLLGITAFEMPERAKRKSRRLYMSAKGIYAEGHEANEGFVVIEGSKAVLTEVASMQKKQGTYYKLRKSLVEAEVLVSENGAYRFSQDYSFSSPSAAAAVILGRAANGRTAWKNSDGVSLKKLQEAQTSML